MRRVTHEFLLEMDDIELQIRTGHERIDVEHFLRDLRSIDEQLPTTSHEERSDS